MGDLLKDKNFYKDIVTDLVNTVIPTTPNSIWDMDNTDNGRSAQAEAVGAATSAIAELISKEKPVKYLSPCAVMDSLNSHTLPHVRKVHGPGLVQAAASIKHLDRVYEEPKNPEMSFVEKFYIAAVNSYKSYLLSKTIAKMVK